MTHTTYALNMGVQACPFLTTAIPMLKTHMSMPKQRFIRPAQGPLYGVSRATIYNWIRDGFLKDDPRFAGQEISWASGSSTSTRSKNSSAKASNQRLPWPGCYSRPGLNRFPLKENNSDEKSPPSRSSSSLLCRSVRLLCKKP